MQMVQCACKVDRQPLVSILIFYFETEPIIALCCLLQASWPVSFWGFSCFYFPSFGRNSRIFIDACYHSCFM